MSDAPGAAPDGGLSAPPASAPGRLLRRLEHALLIATLLAAAFLPLADTLGRPFGLHVPAGADYLKQVVLWLAFLGGLVATRERRHLTLSTAELFGANTRVRRAGRVLAAAVSAATVGVLTYAAVGLVLANREEGRVLLGGTPVWLFELVMPLALGAMALRFAWAASRHRLGRGIAFLAIPAAFAFAVAPDRLASFAWPIAIVILVALVLGTPVFVAMAALALFFFFRDGIPVTAVTAEVYRLISSPTLPAIPLLTGCGYVLAESQASLRLLRFFKSLLGWMPGGLAVIVIAVCALFTTFTGGSGHHGDRRRWAGAADAAARGLPRRLLARSRHRVRLARPAVPAEAAGRPLQRGRRTPAQLPADLLFLGGLLPGMLMVLMVAAYGVREGQRHRIPRQAFVPREVVTATWAAKWELALPVFVVGLFLSGNASIVEAQRRSCSRSSSSASSPATCTCGATCRARWGKSVGPGGPVLILVSAAMGLTSYMVDAQIPDALVTWVKAHIALAAGCSCWRSTGSCSSSAAWSTSSRRSWWWCR